MRRSGAEVLQAGETGSGFLSGTAAFRPMARLIRLIGAELISDEIVAIAELVKNAYDADAHAVRIVFERVTDGEGTIRIEDDGHGMGLDDLLEGWMRPGWTTKAGENGACSPGGRRVLGEKGIGRFAADKLARHLELRSRQTGSGVELRAWFDWDRYDDLRLGLSDLECRYETVPANGEAWRGVRLQLRGLRTRWTERMFGRLASRLARLSPPYSTKRDFVIQLESDEFPDYGGNVGGKFLARAPYRLALDFDGTDRLTWRPDKGATCREPWVGSGPLTCGPVQILLHAYDLETSALSYVGLRAEVRAWLRSWSGISVYRDGFRVWPYGEPHDDWLRLDQRRVNNPTECLSNNQIVGFIEIGRSSNPELVDQTNREGLVQNRAFEDLRRLALHAIARLEEQRQRVRRPRPGEDRASGLRKNSARETPISDELGRLVNVHGNALEVHVRRRILSIQRTLARREAGVTAELGRLADKAAMAVILQYLHGTNGTRSESGRAPEHWSGHTALFLTPGRRRMIDVPAELNYMARLFGEVRGLPRLRVVTGPAQLVRTDIEPVILARLVFLLLIALSRDGRSAGRPPTVQARVSKDGVWCYVDMTRQRSGARPASGGQSRHDLDVLQLAQRIAEGCRGWLAARAGERRGPARIRLTLPAERPSGRAGTG